jgi:hypothetical protein
MKKLDVLKVSDKKKERWFVYERRRLDWWDNPRAASSAKRNETRKGRIEMSQIVRIYADREWWRLLGSATGGHIRAELRTLP